MRYFRAQLCATIVVTLAINSVTTASGAPDDEPLSAVPVASPAAAETTPVAATAEATTTDGPAEANPLTVASIVATVQIGDATRMTGTILETTELPMKTSFGEANIPLSEVAGIRMAQEGNATTTVVLHNGDAITGATELHRLVIATEWGKAEINGPSITSILFSQGVKWETENGLTGQRWKLVEAEPKPAKTTATTQPASTLQSSRPVARPRTGFYTR